MAITNVSSNTARNLAQAALNRLGANGGLKAFGDPSSMMGGGGGDTSYDSTLDRIGTNPAAFGLGLNTVKPYLTGGSTGSGGGSGGGDYSGGGGGGYYGASSSGGGGGGGGGYGYGDSSSGNVITSNDPGVTGLPFTPVGLDTLIADPSVLLKYMLDSKPGNEGIYAMTDPYTQYANNIFLAMNGNNADAGSKENTARWMTDYFNDLMTPGSAGLDLNKALNNIYNPAEGSPLASALRIGTPKEQADTAFALTSAAVNASMNPLMANAIMKRLDQERTSYLAKSTTGAIDPFYEYVRTAIPQGASRLIPGL